MPQNFVKEFFLECIGTSLQSVFVINMESSFEIYLIDTQNKCNQINLLLKMPYPLMTTTR